MKKALLFAVALLCLVIAGVACDGGGGGGGGNPGNGTKWNYDVSGNGFGGSNGETVGFRILKGTTVVYCSTAGSITGANFTLLTATSSLDDGQSYHGEVFVSQDGNGSYDNGDLAYYDPAIGTSAGTVFVASSNHAWTIAAGTEQPVTWPTGTTCP